MFFALIWTVVGTARWLFRPAPAGVPFIPIAVPLALLGIVAVAAFVLLVRRVATPIGDLVAAAENVSHRHFDTRVVESGPAPVRTVARAFNTMASRLEAQDRARRNLMADIAHELRTPLSVIQGRIEGLLDGVYPRDDALLGQLLEETRVLARLIDDLRTLAQTDSGTLILRKEPTDLSVVARETADGLASFAAERDVQLSVAASSGSIVDADPLRIREVLTNLVANALAHTPPHGTVTIDAVRDGHQHVVSVTDTGVGISPEDLPRIFDRFYKGSESSGSGLGLAIARDLVVAHGGNIEAVSNVGTGTTVRFTLPAQP
jgi:two-component system sensor histidine kinase BaeS